MMIASGFASYGYRAEPARIVEGLFTASTYTDLRRLPGFVIVGPGKCLDEFNLRHTTMISGTRI